MAQEDPEASVVVEGQDTAAALVVVALPEVPVVPVSYKHVYKFLSL